MIALFIWRVIVKFYQNPREKYLNNNYIYRDGVGDGQLKTIRDYEIPQLKLWFKLFGVSHQATLTYIVVQKRINTRIFAKANGNFENPPPGTVVDHAITRRDWYVFVFLFDMDDVAMNMFVICSKTLDYQIQCVLVAACHMSLVLFFQV